MRHLFEAKIGLLMINLVVKILRNLNMALMILYWKIKDTATD